jgi:hypothetical protein
MEHREAKRPMTDKEIDDVAATVDKLGERTVNALVAETDRDAEEFDVDTDDYEFPGSDS